MTAVEIYYSTLASSDRPYFIGEDDTPTDDPFFTAAEQEIVETEIYKHF